jgi:hypothetical protein
MRKIRVCSSIVGSAVDVDLFMLYALLGHPGCYSVGIRVLPRGQSRLDVDCSCASSIEVKTEWSYTSTSWRAQGQIHLHLFCAVLERGGIE